MPYKVDTRLESNSKVLDFDGEALIQLFLTPQELYSIANDYCPESENEQGAEIRNALFNLINILNRDSMESYWEHLICPFKEGSVEYENYQNTVIKSSNKY